MLVPALIVGIIALYRQSPAVARKLVAALFIANLLTPASHVVATWTTNAAIRTATYELALLRHPPATFTPSHHVALAIDCVQQDNPRRATAHLNHALQLDPRSPEALTLRARIYQQQDRIPEAVADYRRALRYAPENWPARRNITAALDALRSDAHATAAAMSDR